MLTRLLPGCNNVILCSVVMRTLLQSCWHSAVHVCVHVAEWIIESGTLICENQEVCLAGGWPVRMKWPGWSSEKVD